jgi:biopolymer transport protein TolR
MRKVHRKKRLVAEINVVPYIDVMLVLLIIFMVTAPMLMQGVEVELPKAGASTMEKKEEPIIVSVDREGGLYINLGKDEKKAQSISDIKKQVETILKNKPDTAVLVWGDVAANYGQVVALMTELQSAGAESVGLVTDPPGK